MLEEGKEAMTTRLMLALRTREGIEMAELRDTYGEELGEAAAAACRAAAKELPSEWVAEAPYASEGGGGGGGGGGAVKASGREASGRASGRFALADPEGLLFSNDAISTTFARLDERLERLERQGGR